MPTVIQEMFLPNSKGDKTIHLVFLGYYLLLIVIIILKYIFALTKLTN